MAINIRGFNLEEPPYEGGMALVYKGSKGHFRRAFKLLRPDRAANNPKLSQMFLQEIQLLSDLRHPNIVDVYDAYPFTMPDGHTVTVLEMEWLDGMTLEKYVAENGTMPVDRVRDIARQVIAGMKHAHAKNVLHLDLKPSNLFLTSEGTVKIIDFGIAKVVGANADIVAGAANVTVVTTSGESAFAGTLAYAAPEQRLGGKLTFAADIYSFGQTLHYLLTGTTDPDALVDDEVFGPVVDKCILQAPKQRYATFDDVLAAIDGHAGKVKCPKEGCGRMVDAEFTFCPYCNTRLVKPAPQQRPERRRPDGPMDWSKEKLCPHCSSRTSREERMCEVCGKDTAVAPDSNSQSSQSTQSTQSTQSSQTSQSTSQTADWANTKICPHCSRRTARAERMCQHCGKDTVIHRDDSVPENAARIQCPRCQRYIDLRTDNTTRFCHYCGREVVKK